jgi:hypothetical protein
MNGSPILTINQPARRSRLSTLFRLLLVIPHVVVLSLWAIAALLASIPAWFAILFSGRYPEGLWKFNAGFVRYAARVYAYEFLVADRFPPFSSEGEYEVQLTIPRLERYNRLKTGLRIFYIIPAYIVTAVLGYLVYLIGLIDWLVIVLSGRQPDGLQSTMAFIIGWNVRLAGLLTLVTETYALQTQTG